MQQRVQSEVSVDDGLDDFMAGLARRNPGEPEFHQAVPRTEWLKDVVDRDDHGFILSGRDTSNGSGHQESEPAMLETSVPGVFVAGDVRHGGVKRVASAVGEGSMAVMFVHRYLSQV
jgi:thioredoxin reductase (NADPH)